MFRPTLLFVLPLLAAAALTTACGSSTNITGPTTPPVQINEAFTGTLTVNGARTFPFGVQQTGAITATLTTLAPDSTVTVGLSLGTWNGIACQVIIAKDDAVLNSAVTGNATGTGNFCVRVFDAGKLPSPTDFTVTVAHY